MKCSYNDLFMVNLLIILLVFLVFKFLICFYVLVGNFYFELSVYKIIFF